MAGAPVGNDNATKGKKWSGAIRRALHEYESDTVKQGEALLEIAKGVVRDALAGDKDARAEIGNRLDGKPAQAIIGGDDDDPAVKVMTEITIRAIDADRSTAKGG